MQRVRRTASERGSVDDTADARDAGHDYLSDVDPTVEAVIEARVDNL